MKLARKISESQYFPSCTKRQNFIKLNLVFSSYHYILWSEIKCLWPYSLPFLNKLVIPGVFLILHKFTFFFFCLLLPTSCTHLLGEMFSATEEELAIGAMHLLNLQDLTKIWSNIISEKKKYRLNRRAKKKPIKNYLLLPHHHPISLFEIWLHYVPKQQNVFFLLIRI